ncbi:hypothetical protein CXP39_01605 [Mesoplasma syrphidae]|uniref:Uncharacterized protein n=1 Tax=Mesoplasma syrphidae TaxID=225999 RepID=A0A2K9C5C4_9MOLU|nr:hypothetical protein [Mesoplasma syrphidae]AUF83487.1 hypothetical protein CXP39_01605 [Mesoplasma syrphidae]
MKKLTCLKLFIFLSYIFFSSSIVANIFFKIILLDQKTEIILIWFYIQFNVIFLLIQLKEIYKNARTAFLSISTYNLKANLKVESLCNIYTISIPSFLLLQWQTTLLIKEGEAEIIQRLLFLETFAIAFSIMTVIALVIGLFVFLSIKRVVKWRVMTVLKSLIGIQLKTKEVSEISLFILLNLLAAQIRTTKLNWHQQHVVLPLLADESLLKRICKKKWNGSFDFIAIHFFIVKEGE